MYPLPNILTHQYENCLLAMSFLHSTLLIIPHLSFLPLPYELTSHSCYLSIKIPKPHVLTLQHVNSNRKFCLKLQGSNFNHGRLNSSVLFYIRNPIDLIFNQQKEPFYCTKISCIANCNALCSFCSFMLNGMHIMVFGQFASLATYYCQLDTSHVPTNWVCN